MRVLPLSSVVSESHPNHLANNQNLVKLWKQHFNTKHPISDATTPMLYGQSLDNQFIAPSRGVDNKT